MQTKLLSEHLYNSATSFILFYRDYKAGKTPMPEHYHSYVAKQHPDSLSCVGNSIVLHDRLLTPESYFMEHYPDLERYLYYSCSNIYEYIWLESIPEEYHERPPLDTSLYQEHVLLTLKISLRGREGYVLMDTGCDISVPVVVMADGKHPHTEPFTMVSFPRVYNEGPPTFSYKLQGSYIHWIENVDPPRNRWIYISKKFNKLQEVEKRNLVADFHALSSRDRTGLTASIFCFYGRKPTELSVFTNEDNTRTVTLVPFDYLLADRNDIVDYETRIDMCAIKMRIDREELKGKMKTLAEIGSDKAFMEALLKLDNEYSTKLENCWGNSFVS